MPRNTLVLIRLESRLVQIPERLHIPTSLKPELVHRNIRRRTRASIRTTAACAHWWLAALAAVEHGVDARDGLA